MNAFFGKQLEKDININTNKSKIRTVNKDMTSHFEGLLTAIYYQKQPKIIPDK